MNEMAKRIHEKRKEYDYTMEQLALMIGVNKSSVSKWEAGATDNIKRAYIARMAELFHVKPSWLMGYDNESEVTVTYESLGKEPVKLLVEQEPPIMGVASLRAKLLEAAVEVAPENLSVAIKLLKSLRKEDNMCKNCSRTCQ